MATRTMIGHPGDKLILPKGVKITSIVKDVDIDATSTCETVQQRLDTADNFACFSIYWAAGDSFGGGTPAFGSGDSNANIIGIGVGTRELLFSSPVPIYQGGSGGLHTSLQAAIDSIRDKPIIMPVVSYVGYDSDRFKYALIYKAADTIGASVYLIFKTSSFTKTYTFGELCADCCGATTIDN